MELFIFIFANFAIGSEQLNRASTEYSYQVVYESFDDFRERDGFLPIKFDGQLSGFEVYGENFNEFEYKSMFKFNNEPTYLIQLKVGGDPTEAALVFYTAVLLSDLYGAAVFDPQGGKWLSSEELHNDFTYMLDIRSKKIPSPLVD